MVKLVIPRYNQLDDPLPDDAQDPYATTDCGEECVSMVGAAYHPLDVLPAGQIRMVIRGNNPQGYGRTNADDLVYGLRACFNLPSHTRYVNFNVFQQEVVRSLNAQMPAIVLGTWDSSELHWMVAIGYDLGLIFNDPWGGIERELPWSVVLANFAESYVHMDQAL